MVIWLREGWERVAGSCCSLTEEAAPALSLALGTAALVVAGTALELVALGLLMLRVTPTASQTSAAKARVTGKGVVSVSTLVALGFGVGVD